MKRNNYYDVTDWQVGNTYTDIGEVINSIIADIKNRQKDTNVNDGGKPAGGINTVNDAIIYYTIVKELLGEEWLDNQLFRLGTSRLANLLLSDIKGEEIKFF